MNRLISIQDLDNDALHELVETGQRLADGELDFSSALRGKRVGLWFTKPSTRTRTSFFAAIDRMGGSTIVYSPSDLQTSTGESLEDTGMVLGLYLDALVIRTNGSTEEMTTLADSCGDMVVVNALSKAEHPTQALADLIGIQQEFGSVRGRRVLYTGAWNNTVASLSLALTRFQGTHTTVLTPEGFGAGESMESAARANAESNRSSIEFIHDPSRAPSDVDVVYTVRWRSMGEGPAEPEWLSRFQGFEVGVRMWKRVAHASTIFMHDLPAHRGLEVEAEVIDGPFSRVRRQAYNKMISAMCILERLVGAKRSAVSNRSSSIVRSLI